MRTCIRLFVYIAVISIMLATEARIFEKKKRNKTRVYRATKINKVYELLKKERIIPDVTSNTFEKVLEHVYHMNGTFRIRIDDHITKDYIRDQPIVHFEKKQKSFYTLIVHNIDAEMTYDEPEKNWIPYIVVNIHSSRKFGNFSGEVLSPYRIPDAAHLRRSARLVYLVYHQPGNMSFEEVRNKTFTSDFDVAKFAETYDLLEPKFGTFVHVFERFKENETVPTRRRKVKKDYYASNESSETYEEMDTTPPITWFPRMSRERWNRVEFGEKEFF